jgi:16S rRNA C967 or C1407 C5-methylase (RsmB/RsmF family)/NOL1/NOP2/fmu family ribosome biogenesis protein
VQIPEQIIHELKERFSVDEAAFVNAHNQSAPVSVRINSLKKAYEFELAKPVPWTRNGFYLRERPVFTADPLFHAGCYYVQEASSMFLEHAFRQAVDTTGKLIVLDACAAPGGKSTLLASLLNEESLLVSNEVISTRVPVLVHNMAKWGTCNSVVSNNDPKDFGRLPDFFDVLVVDAPCSGSGLFRRQEDAVEHWSEENVKHCSLRQQRILHDLLPALKENGILIYSTCSYSVEEDENICDYLCNEFDLESVRIPLEEAWGIIETESEKHKAFGYRFFPYRLQGEGFFLTCFRKKSGGAELEERRSKINSASATEKKVVEGFFALEDYDIISAAGELLAYSKKSAAQMHHLQSALKLKKWPLHLGQIKGKDFIPHPYLAYIPQLNPEVKKAEVDKDTALKFLKKQDVRIETPPGFILLTYKNFGLGWAKNLGTRLNNYYPSEWRILKDFF